MTWSHGGFAGERVQYLQAQLFPIYTISYEGFLGSFLSKNLKTNQLEVNTDEKTLRPIARLKEPRDLFALSKDSSNDCAQQAARWPTECQVLEERVYHIESTPEIPEPYYKPTGHELRPRPVGEENGIVVFNYNPVSAVHYKEDGDSDEKYSDSDTTSNSSRCSSVEREKGSNNDDDEKTINRDNGDGENSSVNNGSRTNKNQKKIKKLKKFSKYFQTTRSSSSNSDLGNEEEEWYNTNKDIYYNNGIDDEEENDDNDNNENNQNVNNKKKSKNHRKKHSKLKFNDPNHDFHNEYDDRNNDGEELREYYEPDFFDPTPIKEKLTRINPIKIPFSRSSVGGSKIIISQQQADIIDNTAITDEYNINNGGCDSLEFESRFESGNLAKAVKITSTYYELYLRPDMYTNRHRQWFYFRVSNTKKNVMYRFSIVNLVKSDSLYNEGMRPLMYSNANSKLMGIGWRRCGDNICYFKNDEEASSEDEDENTSYTLTFNIQFPHDNDTVYFAHSYPYTYSDLQDYLMAIQNHPVKSKYCKLRLLCRSLAGNNVYYLTVTAPSEDEEIKKKKAIVVSARVHPGETPSSWMMKGLMDFITGDTNAAKRLRHKFIFKLIPMLNPDGVIVGNTRSSLTGKDLNRQYRTVIRETYPSIWYTKAMIKRLIDDCGVAMYCDMHAHSRAHNIFIYGCENKRQPEKKLLEQVFPLMVHKNCADKFSFESCKFKIQRSKEGTGRIVIWMLGILNSYTIEASFGGTSLGSRSGTHFSTADYEHVGRTFCETLLDYYDEHPHKERLRHKIIDRLLKEGSSADEPLNIPLSDYSSDEGDDSSSSSSENEGKSKLSDLEGPCCQPMKAPPCTPDLDNEEKELEIQKVRKAKLRIKTNKRKKKQIRKTLDLPTTDPGSDIQFSSDDELTDGNEGAGDGYDTIPKTRRTLMNSDLQRKYIEGETDSLKMPPELIVTPAKKKNDLSGNLFKKMYPETMHTFNNSNNMTEFPPISDNNYSRRTNSWHTYNKQSVPKIRVHNSSSYNTEHNTDNLQFKLSLKKKIWTGVNEPSLGSSAERRRPLSWGIPPINEKRDSNEVVKDEQEELLIACSQKLLIWQEKEPELRREFYQSPVRNKVTINLTVPTMKEDRPISVKSRSKSGRSSSKLEKLDSVTNDQLNKIRKKRNSQNKSTDALQTNTPCITTNTKARPKSLLGARKSIGNIGTINANSFSQFSNNTLMVPPLPKSHKFKATGLVAQTTTNVQSSSYRKKRNRSIPAIKNLNRDTFGFHHSNSQIEEIIIHTEKSESLEIIEKERQFSKRSKNKNKKKKSKQNL
ncbi:cytosolic carboxypeptidase 1 [Condylostylus longicornis]|uniref:cytosolic carboxypeptidase 1 n=1 Tax=Condylostylus longicornis TaxID=2530218 RepID=UPI00244DA390|nr:cytosolic carboxypeptidase 1 [Condylostylus longicornis]